MARIGRRELDIGAGTTSNSRLSDPGSRFRTDVRKSSEPSFCMASRALVARLSKICSNWLRSIRTSGRPAASSSLSPIPLAQRTP